MTERDQVKPHHQPGLSNLPACGRRRGVPTPLTHQSSFVDHMKVTAPPKQGTLRRGEVQLNSTQIAGTLDKDVALISPDLRCNGRCAAKIAALETGPVRGFPGPHGDAGHRSGTDEHGCGGHGCARADADEHRFGEHGCARADVTRCPGATTARQEPG